MVAEVVVCPWQW
jgi:hypothetical protein